MSSSNDTTSSGRDRRDANQWGSFFRGKSMISFRRSQLNLGTNNNTTSTGTSTGTYGKASKQTPMSASIIEEHNAPTPPQAIRQSILPPRPSNNTTTTNNNTTDTPADESSETPYVYPKWYTSKNTHTSSLEDQSNILSNWFLIYLNPLLRLGSQKTLEQQDIGVPSECDTAKRAYDRISAKWKLEVERNAALNMERKAAYDAKLEKLSEAQRSNANGTTNGTTNKKIPPFTKSEPRIASVIMSAFGLTQFFFAILFYILSALCAFLPVLILEDLVKYFEQDSHTTLLHPWAEVAALFIVPCFQSLLQTRSQVIFQHCSVFCRTAISTLLYEKSLTVSAAGRACTNTGQVVNMMSNDTTQLQRFIQFGGMTLVAPLQIVLSLVLIYRQVGQATWVGVGFMVCLAPVNIIVFSIVGKMRRKVLKYSDLRVKMMNEILNGIRIIKFYAWEKPFQNEVGELREGELKALTNLAYVSAVGFSLIMLSAPIIQPILVFLTYISIQDEPLTAATAFTTVALFNIMRFPFAFLPMGMLQYIQSRIALRRLGRYLELPELEEYVLDVGPEDEMDGKGNEKAQEEGSITMKNCSFSWTNRGAKLSPIDDSAAKSKAKKDKKKKKDKDRRASSSSSVSSGSSGSGASGSSAVTSSMEEASLTDVETLSNLNFTIEAGELVAVVGEVGSGKSSFLSAILGEMEPLNDSKVYMPRQTSSKENSNFIAYSAQTPWVVNDTLKGNILFGRELDEDRYNEVLKSCALLDDLAVLPAGDMTEIGERGINLSGGQKARVSLARALYSTDTKIALLDDPLSAVDSHVGDHLFREAIAGDLAKDATKILVTHHVHFLHKCDKVVVLEGGQIAHYGNYHDLVAKGVDFAGAVDFEGDESSSAGKTETETDDESSNPDVEKSSEEKDTTKKTKSKDKKKKDKKGDDAKAGGPQKKAAGALTSTEERNEGAVAGSAYLHYARSGGIGAFFFMFFIQGVGRACEILGSFWVAHWTSKAIAAQAMGEPLTDEKNTYYINIYAAFGMMGVAGLTIRSILMALHRLRASRNLHENLTSSILRAPVAFFDVTPTGRILNRFAADMDKIDLDITQSLGQGMGTLFNVIGAVGAIISATKGSFLIPLVPIGYLYYIIQKWFRKTSTELQRVTSIAGSPIFADFSQVLSGTSTIRAFDEQKRFFNNCQKSFDNFNASYNLVYMCNFWLGLRLDILGGLVGAFIGGVAVATSSSNFIPAGFLGLALSYAIEVTAFLKHGVRMIATIEADMNSVERVLFYSEQIDAEAPDVIEDKDPKSNTWPSAGQISVVNSSMRYRDGPLVLKDVSIDIKGGEKIGVVGRTGSGKSSLMNALFRIVELEKDGGSIFIDNVDISQIGTDVLRLNISIIPQDPVMFSNTVRYNIDPFGAASEDEIWDVLRKVQLEEVIRALPEGLDDQVAEGGENFSQGQRQLLCIARSLLRKPKVLVMDEATASIDNSTDAAIQKMIRENFSDATVLTIAHRLNTILDSDRVLVMDDGKVAEFDTPKNLMAVPDGIFKGMVEKSKSTATES